MISSDNDYFLKQSSDSEQSGDMGRVDAIVRHPLFSESIERIATIEEGRLFCKHDIEHFLAVGRIAYILCLEEGFEVEKDRLYAAALLHDLGRWRQYEDGTPHEEESARIAERILPDCGFGDAETELILHAIRMHRTKSEEPLGFAGYLYRADKISRLCFDCPGKMECDWEVKNFDLRY